MFSYTKLKSGEWGLRLIGECPFEKGAIVNVTTKAGAVKRETLGNRVWQGTDRDGQQVTLWAIHGKEAPKTEPQKASDDGFFGDDGGEFA